MTMLGAAGLSGGPARAENADTTAIESCIQSKIAAEQDVKRCIGVLAQPCLDDPKGQSTAGMVACLEREARAWDRLLNDYYTRLSEQLDGAQREALRDLQRSWIAYRDKACGFYRIYHQGTVAGPMTASCLNDETARRALALRDFLSDAEGR
jgi:uncharacterized protein YecT (DUF1311 family)